MADVPWILNLVTAPSGDPISVDKLADFLRVDVADEMGILGSSIQAAVNAVQLSTSKQLLTATYDLKLRRFWCGRQEIPMLPLQSITSVKYLDINGDEQTLASSVYSVQLGSGRSKGYLQLAVDQSWPSTYGHDLDVTVRFVCGFGAASDVPAELKQQVMILAAHFYMTRGVLGCSGSGGVVPLGYEHLDTLNSVMEFC